MKWRRIFAKEADSILFVKTADPRWKKYRPGIRQVAINGFCPDPRPHEDDGQIVLVIIATYWSSSYYVPDENGSDIPRPTSTNCYTYLHFANTDYVHS